MTPNPEAPAMPFTPEDVTITTRRVDTSPYMDPDMDHWKVTLHYQGRRMTVPFSMGYGLGGRTPTVRDVMPCLVIDTVHLENTAGLEDWARDIGYDPDSLKARRIYRACQREAKQFRALFGDDLPAAMGHDWEA